MYVWHAANFGAFSCVVGHNILFGGGAFTAISSEGVGVSRTTMAALCGSQQMRVGLF